MIRRIALGAAAAALAFGGVAMAATGADAAKPPPFAADGTVNCNIAGKVKISPALTNSNPFPSTTTAKIKGTCSGTTGNPAVTPSAVKATVQSVGTEPGTCDGLVEPGDTPFTAFLEWKALGGKINPSSVTFPGLTPIIAVPPGFALNDGDSAAEALPGVPGSYAGNNVADANAFLDAFPDFSLCDPQPPKFKPPKGIKKLTIASGNISIAS
jgi:hypothetical protein